MDNFTLNSLTKCQTTQIYIETPKKSIVLFITRVEYDLGCAVLNYVVQSMTDTFKMNVFNAIKNLSSIATNDVHFTVTVNDSCNSLTIIINRKCSDLKVRILLLRNQLPLRPICNDVVVIRKILFNLRERVFWYFSFDKIISLARF